MTAPFDHAAHNARRAQPLNKVTFAAFQLSDPKVALDPSTARHVGDFATLEEAQIAAPTRHKQRVMIRERDDFTGRTVLHFYQVKQRSQTMQVRVPGMAHTVGQRPLYLEHLFDMTGDVL